MTIDQNEIERLKQIALDAIEQSLNTEAGEFDATLFVSHHLDELDDQYWQKHLGTSSPKPAEVLKLLCLKSHWGDDDDGIDTFDFYLPDEVSDYMMCVRFDQSGQIEGIAMES